MIETQTPQIDAPNEYQVFQRNRQSLSRLTARLAAVFDQLGIGSRAQALSALKQRLDSDRFKVMVLGEFKRGKSTFINALLGEEVLPTDALPCTAVINEIKWAEARHALLHFRHPLPSPAPPMPAEVRAHVRRAGSGPAPPMEVPIERLNDYVAIPDPGKDQADSVAESPYARVEVFWPLELCRNGVEIIDSPGLNENATRARVAKDYVANVDAILFVMSCAVLGADSELRVIDNDLRGVGHDYLFFICNRFDDIRPDQRPRLIEFARKKFTGRTELDEGGLFFLSARNALEARMQGDRARFESSGMGGLEKALTRFLTQDRGTIKLLQPSREILYALKDARDKIIPSQLGMLDESLATLESKVAQVRPHLEDAERSQRQIVANINQHRESLRAQVRLEAEKFLRSVADALEGWVMELPLENKVTLFSFRHKEQAEALAKEIAAKIEILFEKETLAWSKKVLDPLIGSKVKAMLSETDQQVDQFAAKIDRIRSTFQKLHIDGEKNLEEPSKGERALAALSGLLAADVFSAAHGARFGFKGLGTSIVTQLLTYGLLVGVLGVTNPILLIAALLGMGTLVGGFKAGSLTERAKKECARSLVEQFRAELTATAQGIAEDVHAQTEEFVRSAAGGLDREIRSIREQVDAILRDKKAGEVQVQAKRRLLADLDSELRDIHTSVEDLILFLAGDGRPRIPRVQVEGRA